MKKEDFINALREYGVSTEDFVEESIKATEKRMLKQMKKDKKEVLAAVANVALNSPTLQQHYELEKKVDKLLQQ